MILNISKLKTVLPGRIIFVTLRLRLRVYVLMRLRMRIRWLRPLPYYIASKKFENQLK
jgi:hypothetical protein